MQPIYDITKIAQGWYAEENLRFFPTLSSDIIFTFWLRFGLE